MAHQSFEAEDFATAATQFEELAAVAEKRGLIRSPQLSIQAGLARIFSGGSEAGIKHIEHGFEFLKEGNDLHKFNMIRDRVIRSLAEHGYQIEAQQLEQALQSGDRGTDHEPRSTLPKGSLPAKCPQCGGTVHPGEVSWIDSQKAMCDYCGSVLEAKR